MYRLAVAAALVAAVGFAGAARAQDAPAGNADNGKRIYMADGCYFCHGRVGQGGAFNGPAPILANTALPFDAFKTQLRTPAADMPPYAEEVLVMPGSRTSTPSSTPSRDRATPRTCRSSTIRCPSQRHRGG